MLLIEDWNAVFAAAAKVADLSLPVYKCKELKISFKEEISHQEPVYNCQKPILPFAASEIYMADVVSSRRLTVASEDCKDIYEITFGVKDSKFSFQAGDTVGILPQNKTTEVNAMISHLSLKDVADHLCVLSDDNKLTHIPVKSTLRYILTHCIDIRCIVKKQFLLALSTFTEDDKEKKALAYLSSKEGKLLYDELFLTKRMCILDIFKVFKTCKPSIAVVFQNCSRLLPRPYSIVNSGRKDSSVLKICFSVMNIGNNRRGLTTSWLEENIVLQSSKCDSLIEEVKKLNINKNNEFKVPVYLRKNMSGFLLPGNLDVPLLLVGPGTGVAPFIGFLEERLNQSSGDIWLFSGCRNPELDFIYEEELKQFLEAGVLTKLITAFSRIDSDCKYVQDSIRNNGEEVSQFIEKRPYIYVCGDQNDMTKQVEASLIDCIVQYQNKSIEEAKTLLLEMKKQKQYIVDVWS